MSDLALDRVGVVMLNTIGNAVHVLPVLNAIKRHHPESRIEWIMQPAIESLIRGHPAVDEVVRYERSAGVRGLVELRRRLRRRPYDVVLDFQDYFKAGLVTAFTRAPVKVGFDRARARDLSWLFTNRRLDPGPVRHQQDQYLEFLDAIDVPVRGVEWRLGPWPQERAWQAEYLGRFARPVAALVIGATRPERTWVPERWVELVDALHHDFDLQPLLIGGRSDAETELAAAIVERVEAPVVNAVGALGLREMVAVLDGAHLVVSLDTGPLHVAVAVGTPVVALLGFSNPRWSGPYHFRELMVDAYGDPGEEYPASREWRPGRMQRITVSQVVAKVALARERYPSGSAPSGQSAP